MTVRNDFDVSIINIAEDFYHAYLRCLEGKNRNIDEYGRIRYDVVNIPAIVNGAFSLELYLKSLSPLSGKELMKKRHSIKKLFLTLDNDTQERIRDEVEKELPLDYTFEKGLAIINNAYTFWRYIHTKPDLGYGLNVTLNVLSVFIEVIRKEATTKKKLVTNSVVVK